MQIFVNALAASAGGGLTYVRNVVPHFATSGIRAIFLVSPDLRQKLGAWRDVSILADHETGGVGSRFRYEQSVIPKLIRENQANVLVSTGNFAVRRSPVPQILLSRNALYTSRHFFADLRRRREYRAWIDTRMRAILAKRSMSWADVTVAPSEAFAEELRRWTGKKVVSIHHGFDRNTFFGNPSPLPDQVSEKLTSAQGAIRMLFVSHYNYYRNFETIFRALPILKQALGDRRVRLFLTCQLRSSSNPGEYRAEGAAALLQRLGVVEEVVELGTIPYDLLHHLYAACDLYVSAAYAETFAHPLVEAMASGLPVVASDMPVHHEICRDAALYFTPFSPEDLAKAALEVINSREQRRKMSAQGLEQCHRFSWSRHVQELIALAESIL
jgi:glycosyltransferase involved in cell wall biosynthesis